MQKIYSGKQLDILYAQAAQLDRLSARDHIERAAVAFERELLRHYASLLVQGVAVPMP